MPRQSLIVVDDFYEDPDAIRALALSLEYYRKPGATYPGREAVARDRDWSPERARLRSYLTDPVDGPCPKKVPFPQGKFRQAMRQDETDRIDGVHEDVQPWSAVVYLSLPGDCAGQPSVGFYRHRETGATELTPEWEREVFGHLLELPDEEFTPLYWAYMRDLSHWQEVQRIENRYNRALLLQAQCFHASLGIFGDTPVSCRLTQHFEYYSDPDPA
jgi:Family of unknown function (DUF6445)